MLCSFPVCVADVCSFRWIVLSSRLGLVSDCGQLGEGIEILAVKRKNPKLALIIDTGFIETGGGSF